MFCWKIIRDGRSLAASDDFSCEWRDKLDEVTLVDANRVPPESSDSGPIVAQDHVFVTYTLNKENEVVGALDALTVYRWRK